MEIKKIFLGIGIFFIFMMFYHYGLETFYPSPHYEKCKNIEPPIPKNFECNYSQEISIAEKDCIQQGGNPVYDYDEKGCISAVKSCDMCRKEVKELISSRNKIVFYISIIVGILLLILGYAILSIEPIGSALLGSGIGVILYGTTKNWFNLDSLAKFVLLAIVLGVMIFISLKFPHKKKK